MGDRRASGPAEQSPVQDVSERDAWIALAAVNGIGDARFGRLVATFGGAAAVLRESLGGGHDGARRRLDAALVRPLGDDVVARVRAVAADPLSVQRRMVELGVRAMTPLDADYPPRLRELDPPPAVLFVQGDSAGLTAQRVVAVVGTRRPTLAGRALAARVAARLVDCGAVVLSGLAVGIDGAAHAAAVEAGGRTIAIIGSGHADPGPKAHSRLVGRILETGGALVGELAPDATASPGTFPRRNRIISILADATLVIEAPARSGAMITARHALDQGRTLFAAPGRPGDPATAGCLALLRETPALPLVGLDELVVDLGYDVPLSGMAQGGGAAAGRPRSLEAGAALDLLGPAERAVAEQLRRRPASADALILHTGLPPAVVSGTLTLLMLRGWAQSLGPAYMAAGPLLRVNPEPRSHESPPGARHGSRAPGAGRPPPEPGRGTPRPPRAGSGPPPPEPGGGTRT